MHNKGFMAVHKEAVCALALSWSLHNWHVLEWEGVFWGVAQDWALQGSDQLLHITQPSLSKPQLAFSYEGFAWSSTGLLPESLVSLQVLDYSIILDHYRIFWKIRLCGFMDQKRNKRTFCQQHILMTSFMKPIALPVMQENLRPSCVCWGRADLHRFHDVTFRADGGAKYWMCTWRKKKYIYIFGSVLVA